MNGKASTPTISDELAFSVAIGIMGIARGSRQPLLPNPSTQER